jgi:hypothetical protein
VSSGEICYHDVLSPLAQQFYTRPYCLLSVVVSSDMQHFLNLLPSLVERFISVVLIHWHRSSTLGFIIVLLVVIAWPPPKSCLEYSYFKWSLTGLFNRMCSYEVIPPGMTTRSLFTAWITYLASIVKWPSNASSASTPHFLNSALSILFRATCITSPSVHFITFPVVWHMIISPKGRCTLGIVLQFSIMYGSHFLLSVRSSL